MPTVSTFYGITIHLYYDEHNPPHFHAKYQGYEASYDFEGNRTRGSMPRKQERLIAAWAIMRAAELADGWDRAQRGDVPQDIDPLR